MPLSQTINLETHVALNSCGCFSLKVVSRERNVCISVVIINDGEIPCGVIHACETPSTNKRAS